METKEITYNFALNRIRKVVKSCETQEQLEVAGKYSKLLIFEYGYQTFTGGEDLSAYFKVRRKKEEMISWLKMLIKTQKMKL